MLVTAFVVMVEIILYFWAAHAYRSGPLGVQADRHIVFNSKHLKQLNFLNVVPLYMVACILCNYERDMHSCVL
jgi:hypothetical protein